MAQDNETDGVTMHELWILLGLLVLLALVFLKVAC